MTLEPILRFIKKGFFVESGAYTGETHSNTLLLEKGGWSGLLVEPNPGSLKTLKSKHRKAYVFEGALSPTRFREVVHFRGMAIREDGNNSIDVIAEPLSSLLKVIHQRTVDFWSLDIEGFEGQVLNSTDFHEIEVGVLLIEVNHQKDRLVEEVMARAGFSFIGNTYYQGRTPDIALASPHKPWSKLDAVYINPAYFRRRSLPVPKRINEDSHRYDCSSIRMRKEKGLAGSDVQLLHAC